MSSGLFGIYNTNRLDEQHWTKNCFNSSFPVALANYMMSKNLKAVYANLQVINGQLRVICDEISIRDVYRCASRSLNDLVFCFESKYEPYQKYSFDSIDGIDLVIKDIQGRYLAPVEVKLTVLPTSATAIKPENEWGSELVVRTATTSYCAFSLWDSVKVKNRYIRDIFEDVCSDIGSWTNDFEMTHKTQNLKSVIDVFEREFINYQSPLVMQPFWKSKGQSPILSDEAFDIIIWSNLAFSRLFLETENGKSMSRPMRASARMARCIWELSKSGKIRVEEIYRQMAFGKQTDKEVSVPGERWRKYITTDRVLHPVVLKESIPEIIDLDYIENLRPERRLDQTLYFSFQK